MVSEETLIYTLYGYKKQLYHSAQTLYALVYSRQNYLVPLSRKIK